MMMIAHACRPGRPSSKNSSADITLSFDNNNNNNATSLNSRRIAILCSGVSGCMDLFNYALFRPRDSSSQGELEAAAAAACLRHPTLEGSLHLLLA